MKRKIRKCKMCKHKDTCYGDECPYEKACEDDIDVCEYLSQAPQPDKQPQVA